MSRRSSDRRTPPAALLKGCDTGASGGDDRCATAFINDFGARAYRRPLSAEERDGLVALYNVGKEESVATGLRLVIAATLQSPNFLYLVEVGKPDSSGLRKLSGYEMASRLSYVLTGTMPDAALFAAAREGRLDSPDGLRAQAERLLASPQLTEQVVQFHTELLGVEELPDAIAVNKHPKYTSFDAPLRAAMLDESRQFVEYAMTKGSGTIEELLSGDYVFPIGPLASVYGAAAKPDADGRAVITDGIRKGLLTLAGLMAVHPKQPSPHAAVNRGILVRRDFLCDTIPPPEQGIDFTPPPNVGQLTAQELLREHQKNPSCKGCHVLMDPIGFGFESYDPLGAYRTKDDGGKAVDSTGNVAGLEIDGQFANAGQMATILGKTSKVRSCMATQWFRFALGREPQDADRCTQEKVGAAFAAGKGNIKASLLALVTSDSFRLNGGL